MTIPLPTGLSSRPATIDDAHGITELIRTCELDSDGVAEVDDNDVAPAFERYGFDPALDTLLVFEGEKLVAWAEHYRGRAESDVHPAYRGRGIGAPLLRWTEDRARITGEREIGQTTSDANTAARDLFRSNGYEPSWVAWVIRKSLTEDAQVPPRVPDGISIRPYETRYERAAFEVIDAAFSEWPGRSTGEFGVWVSTVTHTNFVPELSPMAFDGDELVGAALAYDYRDLGEGWIQQLATKATHRRRGIAQALLHTVFASCQERGRRSVGVSTDSRTGALGLYEKVGMSVVRQYTRYAKRLERAEDQT